MNGLAAIGLYSMIAYGVAQRTRELGVRFALGASGWDVVRLIVAGALRLVVLGLVIGGAIALWAAPRLDSLMFEASTRDPMVYGSASPRCCSGWRCWPAWFPPGAPGASIRAPPFAPTESRKRHAPN